MITKYHHNNIDYNTFAEIRQLFPNVSFPETITPEELAPLGITIIQEAGPVHVPTQEEIVAYYDSIVEEHLDATARQRGYKDIVSLCSYKGSTDAIFNKEGTAAAAWRDQVWRTYYNIKDAVIAGTRQLPTDIVSELPAFTWGD